MAEIVRWPGWRFGPDGKKAIFEREDDVPSGWVDHPSKVGDVKKPAVKKTAAKKSAQVLDL